MRISQPQAPARGFIVSRIDKSPRAGAWGWDSPRRLVIAAGVHTLKGCRDLRGIGGGGANMALVLPSWFKQRQCKAEEAGPNTYRLSGPNLREAFIRIEKA